MEQKIINLTKSNKEYITIEELRYHNRRRRNNANAGRPKNPESDVNYVRVATPFVTAEVREKFKQVCSEYNMPYAEILQNFINLAVEDKELMKKVANYKTLINNKIYVETI